ncbi:MAG: epoxyqueuosine reductase [Candidatus Latescibacteria bacterium]|nr:epoxyqueuosine reductase [Candidatus Latescibacterota bacterium]
MKNQKYLELNKVALKNGASLFGVADLSKVKTDDFLLEKELLDKFTYAISIGVVLSKGVLEDIVDHPTQLYFHHYRQVNFLLDRIGIQVAGFIEQKGYLALPIAASQIVDWQNQRAHLSHKRIGVRAGLGWIGRNNLLINSKFGAQFRLVTILTNMSLKSDKPVKDNCGDCYACLEVCPAQAIKEKCEDFDHLKCFEKLKEFQKKGYVGQYICGVCVKACYKRRGK